MAEVIGARAGRIRRAVVALLAVAAVAAVVPGSASAVPRSFYGLVPNTDLGADDYQLIRQAGVGASRVSVFWQVIEQRNDEFDWTATDQQIGELAASNIRALPDLFGTPAWLASNPATPPVGSDRQQAEWSEFIGRAVRRYGPGGTYWTEVYPTQQPGAGPLPIETWQVWNEVNGPKHFHPKPDVGKYAKLLQITNNAIKGQDSSADILTAGLVSKPTGKGGQPAWTYLKKLLKNKQGKRSFDHVALHPYAANDRQIVKDVKRLRKALKKGGKKKAQTWITEVGWSSVPSGASPKLSKTPQGQAKLVTKTYKGLQKKSKKWKIGGVYWYTWRDFGGGICDWCPDAGLVKSNLEPKPAYRAYRGVAR